MRNHQNPIFKFIKPLVIFNFGGACCICKEVSSNNQVHHIDNNSANNDAFNFALLCVTHHRLVHKCKFVVKPNLSYSQRVFFQSLNIFLTIYKP
jgi:hypothetical protein